MKGNLRRAVFFDRDGVVNVDPDPEPYVLSWDQWRWMPGLAAVLRRVKDLGYVTVLVTSQRCVGKGTLTPEGLAALHRRMQSELGELRFDGIWVHTGVPGDPVPAKPDPGMVRQAAEALGLDLARSWLIGDADRDIAMGWAAGVGVTVRLAGLKEETVDAHHRVRSLEEFGRLLEAESGRG
jgi:D-glycero-D-manno-heptose 1,7-bisphosphate phosphatase